MTDATRRPTTLLSALAAAALALTLAACGSGAEPEGSGGDGPAAGVTAGGDYEQDMANWTTKFDTCLRAQGIDVPEAEEGTLPDLSGVDQQKLAQAHASCTEEIGPAPIDPDAPSDAELDRVGLAFAKCLRAAGYDYPDPDPDSASVPGIRPGEFDEADVNRCSDEAEKAAR